MASASPADRLSALRVVDANANRAQEGLRAAEDYFRLVCDDAHLARLCKVMRHDLATALAEIPLAARLAARDTLGDVGTAISTPQEGARAGLRDVLVANLERVPQALRAIEEYAKVAWPGVAAAAEQLRYRCYTLAKAAHATAAPNERLATAQVYALLSGEATAEQFQARLTELLAAGPDVIQLRDKQLADRDLLARGRALRSAIDALPADARPLFIFNDRPDLALLCGADGVHVGQEELTVRDVRQIVGPDLLLGVSTHNLAQAQAAVLAGASYLGCGPTFPSGTKAFHQFPGLDFLKQAAGEIRLPAFAIGGITPENVGQVFAAGFRRIAVSGALAPPSQPGAIIAALRTALGALPAEAA